MVPGLADRFVRLLPEFAAELYDIGVSPGSITVQIDGHLEFLRFSGHVAMSVGQVFNSRQYCEAFSLHGVRFEVRTQPKVWGFPTVVELCHVKDGLFVSIPNR